MGIVIKSGGPDIAPGVYPGALVSVEEQTIDSGVSQYNPSGEPQDVFVWTFDVSEDGDEEALEVSGVTSQMTGPKSKTMAYLRALGLDPQPQDDIALEDLVGRRALCTVEPNAKGWPKISGLTAVPKARKASAAVSAAKPQTVREQLTANLDSEDDESLPF